MSPTVAPARGAEHQPASDRLEIDRVAGELVLEYGSLILEDAIRYSRNRADAEDAYQRSLEILLTKAPTTNRDELVPWLRTVVKREALAIANSRPNEYVGLAPEVMERPDLSRLAPDAVAESMADLAIGAEALERLSLDQVRCLIAQSKGLTYEEICEETGFSRRKVTRCIEKGRRAFAVKLDAIGTGSECERMQPLMHRVLAADSEAALELRPHLRHCVACRARLRAYESAPRNVAVLFPPSLLFVGSSTRGLFGRLSNWLSSAGDRVATQFLGADHWLEVTSAKKAIAVAAVAASAATGGVAVHAVVDQSEVSKSRTAESSPTAAAHPMLDRIDVPAVRRPQPHHKRRHRSAVQSTAATPPQQTTSASATPPPAERVDDGSAEFAPEARGTE